MNTRAVLLSATGLEASSNIRQVAAAFDETTNLSATYLHPDSWRVRYRINTVNISLPPGKAENAHHPQMVLRAATMTCKGKLSAVYSLIITTNYESRSPGGTGMLTFYHLSARGPPVRVGSFSVPYKEGPMEVSALAETESKGCWVFSVRMTHHTQPYALISKNGFGGSENPYIIKQMGPEHFRLHDAAIYRSLPQIMSPQDRTKYLVNNEKWRLLAWISLDKELNVPYMLRQEMYSLPWQEGTQELSDRPAAGLKVKELCDPPKEHHVQADTSHRICYEHRAVLLPPTLHDTYTNVTVSDSIALNHAKERIVTIAVIWRSHHPPHTTTLYVYELPLTALTAPTKPSTPQTIQGKRLISLPHALYGGVHPKSASFAHLPSSLSSQSPLFSDKAALMSGMSLFSSPTDHPATTWTPSHPKLYIWGPPHISDHPTEITIRSIDLSFSDAASLLLSNRKINPAAARTRIDDTCACRLHDKGWNIILPASHDDIITGSQSFEEEPRRQQPPTEWVKGFWGGLIPKVSPQVSSNKPDSSGGAITQADSERRTVALERLENWKRARVVRMKRAGLADWEVKDKWYHASWSHYGKVGRPLGWEREWRGWEKEMEMQLGPLGNVVTSEYQPSAAAGKPEFRFSISTTDRSWIPRWLL
ncbi:MAG: hypothetical protein OHK93_005659 [Ramalina farinacea]|uniref:Uncharacterized protein n=1 Tax=Ramalina farinacea TaxID=258253 RepID=A0AA43QK74_9LECA|nr:hypothetical protein [Ramalina farinacea]